MKLRDFGELCLDLVSINIPSFPFFLPCLDLVRSHGGFKVALGRVGCLPPGCELSFRGGNFVHQLRLLLGQTSTLIEAWQSAWLHGCLLLLLLLRLLLSLCVEFGLTAAVDSLDFRLSLCFFPGSELSLQAGGNQVK